MSDSCRHDKEIRSVNWRGEKKIYMAEVGNFNKDVSVQVSRTRCRFAIVHIMLISC